MEDNNIEIKKGIYNGIVNFTDDLDIIIIHNKYGLINKKGEIICDPKYYWIHHFQNGFARVVLNNKVGFINTKGQEICPIKYDDTDNFENGFARVELNSEEFYIDKFGKEYFVDDPSEISYSKTDIKNDECNGINKKDKYKLVTYPMNTVWKVSVKEYEDKYSNKSAIMLGDKEL